MAGNSDVSAVVNSTMQAIIVPPMNMVGVMSMMAWICSVLRRVRMLAVEHRRAEDRLQAIRQ